jgi:hypothetical protein
LANVLPSGAAIKKLKFASFSLENALFFLLGIVILRRSTVSPSRSKLLIFRALPKQNEEYQSGTFLI